RAAQLMLLLRSPRRTPQPRRTSRPLRRRRLWPAARPSAARLPRRRARRLRPCRLRASRRCAICRGSARACSTTRRCPPAVWWLGACAPRRMRWPTLRARAPGRPRRRCARWPASPTCTWSRDPARSTCPRGCSPSRGRALPSPWLP
ncbi:hypothetical protein IWW55_007118, partial [Coemansia sp. RSA 2706]